MNELINNRIATLEGIRAELLPLMIQHLKDLNQSLEKDPERINEELYLKSCQIAKGNSSIRLSNDIAMLLFLDYSGVLEVLKWRAEHDNS